MYENDEKYFRLAPKIFYAPSVHAQIITTL